MAETNKPQPDAASKPAVKKAAKKKAPARKRATPKKAAKKRTVTKERVTKKAALAPTIKEKTVAPKPVTARVGDKTSDEVAVTVALEKSVPPTQQTAQNTTPAPQVWWRAAIMVGIVVLIFTYIRNAAHDGPSLSDKNMASAPWGSEEPNHEAAQPHPWELAPTPQAGDFNEQPSYTMPQRTAPRLDPWQAPASDSPLQTKPYYPPPPGPYGFAPSADNAATPH